MCGHRHCDPVLPPQIVSSRNRFLFGGGRVLGNGLRSPCPSRTCAVRPMPWLAGTAAGPGTVRRRLWPDALGANPRMAPDLRAPISARPPGHKQYRCCPISSIHACMLMPWLELSSPRACEDASAAMARAGEPRGGLLFAVEAVRGVLLSAVEGVPGGRLGQPAASKGGRLG